MLSTEEWDILKEIKEARNAYAHNTKELILSSQGKELLLINEPNVRRELFEFCLKFV